MFYFRFTADTPYTGTELVDYQQFEERPTDAELDEMAEDLSRSNAESFEYLVTGWDGDNYEDSVEEAAALEFYYEDCTGTWEEISKEEYDEENS
jgi:hypothetical protein